MPAGRTFLVLIFAAAALAVGAAPPPTQPAAQPIQLVETVPTYRGEGKNFG